MAIQNQQELQFEKDLAHYRSTLDLQSEQYKAKCANELEAYKATEAIHLVSFKATLDFGQHASRGALLLNGAGAIALLAFMGSVRATDWHLTMLAPALSSFAVGALAAVICMGFAYLAQSHFMRW